MNKCKLCLIKVADKTNSHIIPKFLSKRLFENTIPRRTIILEKSGLERIAQDTPKENYILCSNCERKIGIVECYFARILNEMNEFQKHPKNYTFGSIETQEFLICNNYRPSQFILFVYSMIWRVSISTNMSFQNYKLVPEFEEQVRLFLDMNLPESNEKFKNNDFHIPAELRYTLCVMKAKEMNEDTRGIMIAYQLSESTYLLFITEYIIFLYLDESKTEIAHMTFSITNKEKIVIPLAQTRSWKDLIHTLMTKNFNI
jgi:hypothetical protein